MMNRDAEAAGAGNASSGLYIVPARAASILSSIGEFRSDISSLKKWRRSRWRHSLGIFLLLCTVCLWTLSNFLASTIFADNTYSKPFFVTYVNSSFFLIPLIPLVVRKLYENPTELASLRELLPRNYNGYSKVQTAEDGEDDTLAADSGIMRASSPAESLTLDDDPIGSHVLDDMGDQKLGLAETAKLSFEFCFLWFAANYFMAACLEYTTVASSTILTSTSSIWTLLIGTVWGVEHFTVRKLLGVLASLAGVALISTVDMSGGNDENRGTFPHKTTGEIAIGDAMSFLAAIIYGFYAVVMKKRIGDESKVNMPLFFGLVGFFNVILLWPGFVVLHYTGIERFELPPHGKVLTIIMVNSTSSLVSDFCWAFAMLLTSPLITTVGLSMTIPLSLVGQILLDSQYSSALYWIGAAVVFSSFIFINNEETKDEDPIIIPARESLLDEGGV